LLDCTVFEIKRLTLPTPSRTLSFSIRIGINEF
jgi:hypothetical protein